MRNPREEDIEGTLEYLRTTAGETDFLLRYPEECSKYTPEGERELFEKVNASENVLMLMCIVDGRIAGNCQLPFFTGIKRKHRADVAIALLKEYWGLGIGTRMFREMIRIAEENENIIQLELDVVEGNTRAMRLYEKMGFVITGELPNAIRLKDGTLLSDFKMIRKSERNNG